MSAFRHRRLGVFCAIAWLCAGIALWAWHAPRPRSRLLDKSLGYALFLSQDGRVLVTAEGISPDRIAHPISQEFSLSFRDIDTGAKIFQLQEPRASNITFSDNARHVAIMTLDDEVKVWNTATAEVRVLKKAGFQPFGRGFSAFSPNGDVLALAGRYSAAPDATWHVGIWDVAHGKEIRELSPANLMSGTTFSPDGRWLALASYLPLKVQLLDWKTGNTGVEIDASHVHGGNGLLRLVFAPDGETLAIAQLGAWFPRICLAETARGQEQRLYDLGGLGTQTFAFSPDGRLLAVNCMQVTPAMHRLVQKIDVKLAERFFGKQDRLVLLDTQTGEQLESLPGSDLVAFRPDGKTLVTFGNGGVLLWDVPPRPPLWVRLLPAGLAVALTVIWYWRRRRARKELTTPVEG
jgi:WD40 repeat protein